MAKTQKYGIKFPFQIESGDGTMLDLDKSRGEMMKSQLLHLLFTPIGQRLRQPEFGTQLIRFIFNPNDNENFGDVLGEIKTVVKRWIPDCALDDIKIYETEEGDGMVAQITYTAKEDDGSYATYQFQTQI